MKVQARALCPGDRIVYNDLVWDVTYVHVGNSVILSVHNKHVGPRTYLAPKTAEFFLAELD